VNWELIVSIAALLTGGGCVIWIFNAGIWKGEVSTELKTLRSDLDSVSNDLPSKVKSEVGQSTGGLNSELVTTVAAATNQIRQEFMAAINRLHERLDEKNMGCGIHLSSQQGTESKLASLIAGLQEQRKEWDVLRDDVRSLIRSEATTIAEINNFKARLTAFEQKVGASAENIARLESDVAHFSANRRK
jgi:hypothetical protein